MIIQLKKQKQLHLFLGVQIESNLNYWKAHIQYIMPTLSSAWFSMRTVTSFIKTETSKFVYLAYFHSIMSNGIILGWKFNRQQKSILHTKENHHNNGTS
jgi:hypothetical protein